VKKYKNENDKNCKNDINKNQAFDAFTVKKMAKNSKMVNFFTVNRGKPNKTLEKVTFQLR